MYSIDLFKACAENLLDLVYCGGCGYIELVVFEMECVRFEKTV